MKLSLNRVHLADAYTIGKLYIDGVYFCDTLEDRVIDVDKSGKFEGDEKKVYGESAIPYGEYSVTVTMSPRFKRRLPRLIGVPHFDGVLIHRGNKHQDTHGCILVGENKAKGMVLNSKKYEIAITEIISKAIDSGDSVTIEIV